ncbi:helix-turn-helix domain-containing protein [Vibrio litoralis]|jgi:transcriptional regulator with XRE-family HTH domain|uniref:helix-turn-helix domain-containing protein n=1 Tax=Vibrio litoralis TaxID=335972 RepID=UPI001868936B|nr:helix-turn-helix transcriptional regulator [Vibrio litoralis]
MFKSLNSPQNLKLIAWLKQQRSEQGLTMRDLAERLEVPHSFVGKVEQGERRLDVVEYIQYCEALNISPLNGIKHITSD